MKKQNEPALGQKWTRVSSELASCIDANLDLDQFPSVSSKGSLVCKPGRKTFHMTRFYVYIERENEYRMNPDFTLHTRYDSICYYVASAYREGITKELVRSIDFYFTNATCIRITVDKQDFFAFEEQWKKESGLE